MMQRSGRRFIPTAGSALCERGSGSLQAHARSRAGSIQSWFRRTALWAFWFLDRIIKNDLFQLNRRRRNQARAAGEHGNLDDFQKNFGSAVPVSIPESSAWWRHQSKNLFAITEEGEMGIYSIIYTSFRIVGKFDFCGLGERGWEGWSAHLEK